MTAMAGMTYDNDAVLALAIGPGRPNGTRWFAARKSGLYSSGDGGKTWNDAYHSMALQKPLTTAAVAVSPLFGTDGAVFAGAMGGVLRSTDGGETWTVATLPDPPPYVIALAISPSFESDGMAFAATMEDGVFRSWDRGTSWASWNFGLLDLGVLSLAISPGFAVDGTLFAGVESGIFRTTNSGRSWLELSFPIEYAPVLSLALSPEFATDRTIVAGTESQGIFRSTDAGDTWQQVMGGDTTCAVNQIVCATGGAGGARFVALSGMSLPYSADAGQTWFEMQLLRHEGALPTCLCPLAASDAEYRLLIGYDDGQVRETEIKP